MADRIEDILWHYPSVYLTEHHLAHLLGGTPDSRYARLRRATQKGLLVKVKRGLYYLGERLATHPPHPFELAQFIYGPSYISLESALAYHNLIPEAVYAITCASIKRTAQFMTPLAEFKYHRLPLENFLLGVRYIENDPYQFFMASPWKALLDYIYCYKKEWDSMTPLQESLRIELDDLPLISSSELSKLTHYYHSQRITRFIKQIPQEFIHAP
ncbi:MAG: hypothetical protein COB66_02720 [Coxiella sp. (in: Bacteria)]|nr:MAG: hypothetical protein COB66_02720 [Coxiella sp. (in: g-proteobacteria)]